MDLQWSHLVPELFLAAYGAKAAQTSSGTSGAHKAGGSSGGRAGTSEEDTPGMVCVWSKDLHSRPEYRFCASSPVLAAVFHSHEQSLVLGGCYSGQILLWDMKLNKALPVQRSSMSGKIVVASKHLSPLATAAMVLNFVIHILRPFVSHRIPTLCELAVSRCLPEPLKPDFCCH
jgi:dynein intermediate chain